MGIGAGRIEGGEMITVPKLKPNDILDGGNAEGVSIMLENKGAVDSVDAIDHIPVNFS